MDLDLTSFVKARLFDMQGDSLLMLHVLIHTIRGTQIQARCLKTSNRHPQGWPVSSRGRCRAPGFEERWFGGGDGWFPLTCSSLELL